MKRLMVFAVAIGLVSLRSHAQFIDEGGGGQAELVKERAIKVTSPGQGGGGASPSSGSAPSAPPIVTAPPPVVIPGPRTISAEQQGAIDKLDADLTAIKPGSEVTAGQKQQIQDDIINVCRGGTKPTKPLVAKLTADLSAALSSKAATPGDQASLARCLNVLVNSAAANLTYDQIHDFISSAESALRGSGVADDGVQTVGHDLHAITSQLQKSKPKLFQ